MSMQSIVQTLDQIGGLLANHSPADQATARDLIMRLKTIINSPSEGRSAAANKAWATRRANASRAAQANATRDAARSKAANKAWETRRKNGWVHPKSR